MSFYPFDSFGFFLCKPWCQCFFYTGTAVSGRRRWSIKYHQHIWSPKMELQHIGAGHMVRFFEEPMPEKEESVKEFVTRNLGEEVRKSLAFAELLVVGDAPFFFGPRKVPCFLHVEYRCLGVDSCTMFSFILIQYQSLYNIYI